MLYKLLRSVAIAIGITVAIFISIILYIDARTSEPLPAGASALERCVEERAKLLPVHEKVGGRAAFLELCERKFKDEMK